MCRDQVQTNQSTSSLSWQTQLACPSTSEYASKGSIDASSGDAAAKLPKYSRKRGMRRFSWRREQGW